MTWMSTGVFVTLTLVATTLPASGTAAPSVQASAARTDVRQTQSQQTDTQQTDTQQTQAPAVPGSPQNPQNSRNPKPVQDPGLVLQAAPQMDVWKSAPTRTLGSSGPHMLAAIASTPLTAWKPSPSLGQDLQSHAGRVHEHAREWLISRYPNAPPLHA